MIHLSNFNVLTLPIFENHFFHVVSMLSETGSSQSALMQLNSGSNNFGPNINGLKEPTGSKIWLLAIHR